VAIEALGQLAEAEGWMFDASEDPTVFSDEGLSHYNVLVMLSPTGDILDAEQQAAFERYIQAGNGFVGIHAASDTEFDWAWYGGLVGAFFRVHPDIQPATLIVENRVHPSTAHLPETWARTDEWYSFETNPRDAVTVLISIDETSYSPGESEMDGDHPIAWYHEYDGGRSFYTALGHTAESYSEPEFMAHVKGGIEWAARLSD
jgi:type 1 glutamine amidotransferase